MNGCLSSMVDLLNPKREQRSQRTTSYEYRTNFNSYRVHRVPSLFCSGEKSGRVQMVEDMIDRGIVTTEDLVDKYNIEEQES